MKKEILAGLIVIVAIASIAIFVVTPSMSISFEIDGKQTSDEMELLFPGSGDDDYQEYKYVSEKFEKSRIYASAGGAEVYEAGFGGDFLNWLRDLFSGWLNDAIVDVNEAFPIDDVNPEDTDPDVVIEDIGDLVEDEKVGDPGPTPEAGKVIGEYVGPKELIIDGELSEKERDMLEAIGVGEIEFDSGGHRYYTADGGVAPGVKHSRIVFLGDDMYFNEKGTPEVIRQTKSNKLGEIIFTGQGCDYPRIGCSFDNRQAYLIETEEELFKGAANIDSSRKFEIDGEMSGDGNEIECVVKGIFPAIEKYIGKNVKIQTFGGDRKLKLSDIPRIKGVSIRT